MSSWHDTDHFWKQFYSVMFHQRRWDQAAEEADGVIQLMGIEPGAEVLDICWGPGRHALVLGEKGYRVTGVDRTESYIEIARQKAEDAGLTVQFLVDDARSYKDLDRFDAAISLYTSFGYFEDPEEDLRLLENVHASLKEGGAFLIDMNGKEVAARAFKKRSWEDLDDGSRLLEERTVGPGWEWVENHWVVIKDGVEKETTFRVRMYSGVELRRILLCAGFQSVELYGDFEGTPYDDRARRLIAVARR